MMSEIGGEIFMADIRIHSNPTVLNKTLKTQREMYKRQIEGLKSEYAKQDAKDLGLSPDEAKDMMYKLKSDVLSSLENTIAVLDHQKVNNIVTSDALRIFQGGGFKRPSRYPENPELLMFYNELHSKALSFLTGKKSTGQELMWNTTEIADELTYSFNNKANSFSNYADVQESYRYFKSGEHGLTVFDLETFGGKNEFGKQQVDKITEYTFNFYDSTKPGANRERITGFVGLSREEAARYMKEFDDFKDIGSLTEKQRVVARSLAKIGHADTLIEEDPAKRGRFIVKRYGEGADDVLTKDSIFAGIREARRIGEIQEKYMYNGMMAWEEDVANALIRMQKGTSVIAGHNINRADIPWLNQVLAQSYSENMKSYMRSQGFGGQLDLPSYRVLDTLSMLQMADVNPKTLNEIWTDDKKKSILKAQGLTPYQQEALAQRFLPEMFESTELGAHVSSFDVDASYKLITEAKLGNKLFLDRVMELAEEAQKATRVGQTLKQNQQQLFYATKSLGGDFTRESIFGFKVDSFTGNLKTMDGVELAENLAARKTFPEYMTKKGVSYTIDSIDLIKANQEYVNKMKNINPALAVNELVAMKISPVVDTSELGPYADLIQKNLEPSYIVGTKENIKSLFANNFILYGEKDDSGEYKLVDGAQELLGKQKFAKRGNKVVLEAVSEDDLISEIIKDGTFVNINDSAARNIRENKMSRYEALSRFSETINQMAEKNVSDAPLISKKRAAIEKLLQSSKEVARATSKGQAHTLSNQEDPVELLQYLLGYKDFETGNQVIHPRTIDNAIANLEYFESIADDINLLLDEVNKRTEGSSRAEKNFLFSQGLEAIRAKSLEKMQATNADMIGGYVRNFEKDYFEIDISNILKEGKGTPLVKAIDDVNPEGVLKIDLRPGSEFKLIRSVIGDDTTRFNYEQEAIKRLESLVDVIQKENGLLKDFYGDNKAEFLRTNSSATFAKKIVQGLAAVRAQDPMAGYLSINSVHSTRGASEYAGVLTRDEIIKTLEEQFANFRQGMVLDINKEQTAEGARARRNQAIRIVDEFLMTPFDEKALTSYGYNSEQIKKLRMARDVRRRDYIGYMESLLGGVSKTNMSVVLDSKNNVFGLVGSEGFVDLKNVPRERFADGIFYTQVGRNRVATELHLLAGERASDTRLVSAISMAMEKSNWDLERSIDNAIRRGEDPEEKVIQWASKIARSVREGSAITMFDEQDVKSQFEFYEKGVVDALPKIAGLNTLDLEKKEEFLDMVSSKYFSFDNMNDTQKQLWALNREKVLRFVAEESQDRNIMEMVNNISSRSKHSAVEQGRIRFDPILSELELYNRSSRDIENQIRYLAFREDYARERLKEVGMDRVVDLGSHLRTRLGHSLSTRTHQGTTQRAYTEFVTDRIALTPTGFKEKLIQAKRSLQNTNEIKAIDTLLLKGNLTEGGAIGSARLADALFQNYDRQKISFAKELFTDHDNNVKHFEAIDQLRQVIPEFEITEDGKVEFRYKKGRYVDRFDKLFDLKSYGDSITPVGAKYEGALRFGFFTRGQSMLVDEDKVINHVTDLAQERGLQIRTRSDFLSLAEEIYDINFYIERLSVEPYRKVMEDRVEKHMTAFAYYGLGESGDRRILRALSELGLDDQVGKVLDKGFFDELLDEKNISSSILSDISKKDKLTEEAYIQAVRTAGFKDVDEFKQELIQERYLPSDMLQKHLGAPMALINEDLGHQSRAVPITTAVNNLLDREVQRVWQEVGEDNLSRQEASRITAERIHSRIGDVFIKDGKAGLVLNDDGKFELPELSFYGDDYIDTNRMREVYDAEFGEGAFDDILKPGIVTRHSYAAQQDFTGKSGSGALDRPEVTIKGDGTLRIDPLTDRQRIIQDLSVGAKITDREINMLETTRYDQALIDRMSKELSPEDFKNAFGHVVDEVDGNFVLKDDFEGRAVLGDFTDEVRRNQFAKAGEALITVDQLDQAIERQIATYGEADPNYLQLRETVKALSDVSGGNVGLQTAEEVNSIAMNTLAMRFNNGELDVSDLRRRGFEVIKLSEIDRMTGNDGSYLLNDSAKSLFRRNLIIDLQDDIITPDIIQTSSHGNRYLALGAIPTGKVGENLIQSEPHRLIGGMISARNKLSDTRNLTEREIQIQKDNIAEAMDAFNSEISKTVFGKQGLIRGVSELRLQRSSSGKASLMDIQDILNQKGFPDILENVTIDGKSIMDHHRSGVLMDFKILSEDQFRDMGIFDEQYLKELDITEDELKSQLRSGVMGFSHRSPTIYEGSVRPTMLILSDNLHGNQAIEYAAGALSSKADADGDAPRTWLASYTRKDGQTIDAIQYNVLKKDGMIDDQVEMAFRNQKAMMYRNATVMNKYFSEKLADDVAEMEKIDQRIARRLVSLNSLSVFGRMRPGLDRKATPQEAAALMDQYRVVEDIAITEKINDTPSLKALTNEADARAKALEMLENDVEDHVQYLRRAIDTMDPSVQEDYAKAADYYILNVQDKATELAKLKRGSAGEINLPLYQVNKIRNLSHDVLGSDQHRFLTHVLEASEEAFLSPKHSDAKIVNNALTMKEFNRAIRSVAGNPLRGDTAGTTLLEDWFKVNLPGRFKLGRFADAYESEEEAFKDAAKMIEKVFSDRENIQRYDMFLSAVGSRTDGIPISRVRDAMLYPKESTDMMAQTYRALEQLDVGYKGERTKRRRIYESADEAFNHLESKWSPPTDPSLKTSTRNVLDKARQKMSQVNITGKDLAFGALGIAGAIMVAGFVGGNPSKPATTQASEQSSDMYTIPSLSDEGLSVMPSTSGGYVININANTDKGRQHVEEAIQQAMAQSYNSTNINVSMNIRDNTGNITDRNIENIIRGSFA